MGFLNKPSEIIWRNAHVLATGRFENMTDGDKGLGKDLKRVAENLK